MSDESDPRAGEPFDLFRHDRTTWIIRATGLPETDPRYVVAVITDARSDGVHVVWAQPTGRPSRYFSAEEVLRDLVKPLDVV